MLSFFIGFILSYLYSIWVLPKKEGEEPLINPILYPILYKGMVVIPYNNINAIHLHHWIIYLFICLLSIIYFIPEIIIGFSLGLLLQGIQYKDSFIFICDNPY